MILSGLEIELKRKAIRRLSVRVYPGGKIVASVPWLMPKSHVERFIESKLEWLLETHEKMLHAQPRMLIPISREAENELRQYLAQSIEEWRIKLGEEPVTWKLRNMRSQWGNCRAARRLITLNTQLARVPDELREYIVMHEMCHLQIQNHGPEFKALETKLMPDWRKRREALKQYQG